MSASERREAIVGAAIPLLAERGYDSVTTREIAQVAGVSEALLYRHFPSKKEIYLAIWGEESESMDQRIEKIQFGFYPLNSSTIQDDGEAENPVGGGIEGDFFLLAAGDVADDFDPIIDRAEPV